MHELQRDQIELALKNPALPPELASEYRKRIEAYNGKVKKYDVQKQEIEKSARGYEQDIKDSQKHASSFGMAVIFLQIAILLASISALMTLPAGPLFLIGDIRFQNLIDASLIPRATLLEELQDVGAHPDADWHLFRFRFHQFSLGPKSRV